MRLAELLSQTAPQVLETSASSEGEVQLREALHDAEGSDAPLMVRIFTAVGTWIGASLAAFFFAATEVYEVLPLALVLGAGLFALASYWSRQAAPSLAKVQLIWATSLGAHGLLAGSLAEAGASDLTLALIWTALSVGTVFLVRVPSYQASSAVAAVCFATWLAHEMKLPYYTLWVVLPVSLLALSAWLHEARWVARLGGTWGALAYGLPLGATIPLTIVSLDFDSDSLAATGLGPSLASVMVLCLLFWTLAVAKRELTSASQAIHPRAYGLTLAVAVVALIGHRVPGLSLALLWILVAHLRRSRALEGIGMLALSGFLFFFYYQLDTSLLFKSLWVIASAVVVLLGAYLCRPGADKPGVELIKRQSRWIPALCLVLLSTGVVGAAIADKEAVLSEGRRVLLPLGPRDPRSLIQGDYMVLNYALNDEMREQLGDLATIERHGRLVVRVDVDGVGHYVRLDENKAVRDDELQIEYRVRDGWRGSVRVGAESYLFEEGTAAIYEGARFGELVVDSDGSVVLVGLRDQNRRVLGVQLHPAD